LACPVTALLCVFFLDGGIWRQTTGYYLRTALVGAMFAFYQVCYFSSISFVGVSIATLVTVCSAPVLVALLSVLLRREVLTRHTCSALGLAIGRTLLLVGRPSTRAIADELFMGTLLALRSAGGY